MLKQRIESGFGLIGQYSYTHPWAFILGSILLVGFFIYQLQFIVLDTTTEGFLKKNDPALIQFEAFKNEFGRDEQFIIAIETENAFRLEFIDNLINLHRELEAEVPFIDDVTSLYNVRDIYGEDDELIVADLLEEPPETADELAAFKQKVMNHKLYQNTYISGDAELVNIYLRPDVYHPVIDKKTGETHFELLSDKEIHAIFIGIQDVIAKHPDIGKTIHIAGTPALTEELNIYLVGDMMKFILMALVVIGISLYALFRRLLTVFLPLLVMVTALLSTMGMMSLTSQPIQLPTVILPSFILAVGVGDSIHLLTIFFRKLKSGLDKQAALVGALVHTGLPMFFTSITTAASLCSFGRSEILPVANLGLFAAAGVMFAFIYTIILLPALIAVAPVKIRDSGPITRSSGHSAFERFLQFSIRFSSNYPVAIVCVGLLILSISFYSAMQLRFSHDPVKWLPETSQGRQSVEFVGDKIGGSVPIEIVVDSGVIDGVKEAHFMATLEETTQLLEQYDTGVLKVGKVLSATTLLKETNQALFDNDPEAYKIPDSRPLIAQEFLMLETSGAEDLFKLVDSNYQRARITVMTPWVDALYFGDYVRGIRKIIEEKFEGQATVEITGIVPMLSTTLRKIMNATAISYGIAFIVISCMMVALLGSFKYGLISMLPNLLPITIAMGLMQVTGSPLDMFSMLIGSIAIGLSVDDTVHFMHGFRRVFQQTGDAHRAIEETLLSSGRAMLSTSIVLASGFLIYLFSVMNNLQDFGFFTALCIITALLADFWMAPALVLLLNRQTAAKNPK